MKAGRRDGPGAPALRIGAVKFTAASDRFVGTGLLGFVSLVLNEALLLDGITVRRTCHGHFVLSLPERRDAAGRRHPIIRPLDNTTRRSIESEIFRALQDQGVEL